MLQAGIRNTFTKPLLALLISLCGLIIWAAPVAADEIATQPKPPGSLVSDRAQKCTPNIKNGFTGYKALFVAPDTVYVGGDFSSWEDCNRKDTYTRKGMVAYDASSGNVKSFKADTNGVVYALAQSENGKFVYMGGTFTTVNGVQKFGLAKVDADSGKVDQSFRFSVGGGIIKDIQMCDGKLYVAGTFSKRLIAVDPQTGADTGKINLNISGTLGAAAGETRVDKFSINPQCSDLVAIGNFTSVNGQSRKSAFRLDIQGATNLKNWHPTRFDVACAASTPYYLRNVAWADNGNYFVIVSSGGPQGGYPNTGFCDAAGRWNDGSSGSVAQPEWINWTGGDSLYAVAVDAKANAVYVGGHNRWLDNPQGHDSAGPGAYPVDSIGAIHADNGKAIRSWDARPMTRQHGKQDLLLFGKGMVEVSDGQTVSGAYHNGNALFPAR